jgi:hypothetical protein
MVADKAVLVKVNVIANSAVEVKPAGSLRVETSTGELLQTIALTAPTGTLPMVVPAVPSFADSYTAVVPANLVKTGVRLSVNLANGQPTTTLAPGVVGGVAMRIVAVPVQIAGTTGQVVAGVADYTQARLPTASVTVVNRTPYVSTRVTTLPTTADEWDIAFSQILGELNNLRTLEGASAQTHYYGFIPKRTSGLLGSGYLNGRAAVGFDAPSNAADVLRTLTHELGHNLGLLHAPCGTTSNLDTAYPYSYALLGGPERYIWGYNLFTKAFVDPRPTKARDLMGYCGGDTFSDYNYRLMQIYTTPADQRVQVASATAPVGPHDLLLISGTVEASRVELEPVKAFTGRVELPSAGPYTLRLVTGQGVVNYPFATVELDHAPLQQHFGFSIANPGAIASISILRDGVTLLQKTAAQVPKESAANARIQSANSPLTPVQFSELGGVLRVSWNHTQYPYLTVTHVGAQRTGLAQDLKGGSATIQVTGLPPGGSFEFGLSDGLNSVLAPMAR